MHAQRPSIRRRFTLNIGKKIAVGFAAALLPLAVTAAIIWSGSRAVDLGFNTYEQVADNTFRIQAIDRDLVDLRRNVQVFVQNGSDESWTRIGELRSSLAATVDSGIAGVPSEELRGKLRELKRLIGVYGANLDRVAALRQTREQNVSEGIVAVPAQVQDQISTLIDAVPADNNAAGLALARALDRFLLGRLQAWQFLATGNSGNAAAALIEAQEIVQVVQDAAAQLTSPQLRAMAADLSGGLKSYGDAVAAVVAAIDAMNKVVDVENVELMAKMVEIVAAVKDAQAKYLAQTKAGSTAAIGTANMVSLGAASTGILIGILMAWLIGRAISRPIVAMTGAMQRLAAGDTQTDIPAQGRSDEIGAMADAVSVFKQNMAEATRLREEQEQVKARAEAEKHAALNTMADEFDATVKAIVQAVSTAAAELRTTAESMTSTAEETSRRSAAVAAASEEASSNVETVAAAAEQLAASTSEIGRQVTESARIAGEANDDTKQTDIKVRALTEAVHKIGDVLKLIHDIAGQTNLLALNATIEAARAGEAGKGFAVVASEVKNLATQTAKATDDIAAQIKAIQDSTGTTVSAIQAVSQIIGRISDISTTIAAAVEEQGAATQEIARNIQQASAGTSEVSANITGVTQVADRTGAAAAELLGASGRLAEQSDALRAHVDRFILKVRAA